MDQLSTCPLSADVRVKHRLDVQTSQMLQMFLKDPVLSKLNQRPTLDGARSVAATPKLINQTSIHQNDADATNRMNMWNPIVSTPKSRHSLGYGNPELRNLMSQKPFRKIAYDSSSFGKTVQIVNDIHERDRHSGKIMEKKDFIHPVKRIKLSITRLDNAVSFCKAQIQTQTDMPRRKSSSAKTSESSSDRYSKSAKRSQYSDGNDIEINLIKGKIYENPRVRYPDDRHQNGNINCDKHKIQEGSAATGKLPEDDSNQVKEIPHSVKHVSFNDKLPEDLKADCSEHEQEGTNLSNLIDKQTKSKKMFECPALVEAVFGTPEGKTEPSSIKTRTFEYPIAKDKFGNEIEPRVNEIERSNFKGKVVDHFHNKDNGKQKNNHGTKETSQSEMRPSVSLVKPYFGLSSPRQGRERSKAAKSVSIQEPEVVNDKVNLQYKRSDLQLWRLNNINNQNQELGEDIRETFTDQDIAIDVLKGEQITIDNEKTKAQVQFEFEVQSPRSSKRSHSGKNYRRKVKKTALASGVINLFALRIDVLSFHPNRFVYLNSQFHKLFYSTYLLNYHVLLVMFYLKITCFIPLYDDASLISSDLYGPHHEKT